MAIWEQGEKGCWKSVAAWVGELLYMFSEYLSLDRFYILESWKLSKKPNMPVPLCPSFFRNVDVNKFQ